MVIRRKKKVRRQRGTRAHGWGIQKDHKGSGMRGGRGNAGVTQHNWIRTIIQANEERRKPIGKFGFKRPQEFQKKYKTINVSHLDQSIDSLVEAGKATLEKDTYTVDLSALKVSKLLGQGSVSRKINITVDNATEGAVEKVKAAGGKVTLPE